MAIDTLEGAMEEDDEDSDSSDEEEDEEEEVMPKISARKRLSTAFKKIHWGVLLGSGKSTHDELEATQLECTEATPVEEETKIDARGALEKLAVFNGGPGCNCLTLIIPAGTWNVKNLTSQVHGKRARKYLEVIAADLEGTEIPANGLGVFLKDFGKVGVENELIAIEPPKKVKQFALSDGPVFATECLLGLFSVASSVGCVVISGEECILYRIFEDHCNVEARIQPRLQKRQKKGGQSALRISRLAEEVRAAYVRITAERMNSVFTGEEGLNVETVVIGGSWELADNLNESEWLDYRIKQTKKRATEIKETDQMKDVQRKSMNISKAEASAAASSLLKEFEAKSHTSLAAYGVKDVVKRLKEYNLSALIYTAGAGIPVDLLKKAEGMQDVKVTRVQDSFPAHEELSRKWGGAFALLRWEPHDFDEE